MKSQMKTILLLRHAKSSWEMATSDHSRVLASRGITNAHAMGSFVAAHLPESYSMYCSTATRTRQTAEIITSYFPTTAAAVQYESDLYTFSCADLESFVQSRKDEDQAIILFGHNEAITNFVNKFGSIQIDNVPTCGFVVLELPINSWSKLQKGLTKKMKFPKDTL